MVPRPLSSMQRNPPRDDPHSGRRGLIRKCKTELALQHMLQKLGRG